MYLWCDGDDEFEVEVYIKFQNVQDINDCHGSTDN